MHYTGTIWRPPYEAYSALVQVTAGCTHHKCKFCTLYEDVPFKFRMSPLSEIEEDLNPYHWISGNEPMLSVFSNRIEILSKGKEFLRTLGKYYIVDIGLRNYLLGFRDRDSGHAIENVVYFELLRRGYDVSIGKVDNSEVDFIATKVDDKLYVQVTESMTSEDVRKRELAPLQKISDNYEKIVLSLNTGMDSSYDGIKSINLIDWLISE